MNRAPGRWSAQGAETRGTSADSEADAFSVGLRVTILALRTEGVTQDAAGLAALRAGLRRFIAAAQTRWDAWEVVPPRGRSTTSPSTPQSAAPLRSRCRCVSAKCPHAASASAASWRGLPGMTRTTTCGDGRPVAPGIRAIRAYRHCGRAAVEAHRRRQPAGGVASRVTDTWRRRYCTGLPGKGCSATHWAACISGRCSKRSLESSPAMDRTVSHQAAQPPCSWWTPAMPPRSDS